MNHFKRYILLCIIPCWLFSCAGNANLGEDDILTDESVAISQGNADTVRVMNTSMPAEDIHTGTTTPAEIVAFAKTLEGVPYKYGSTDPNVGFDCSGFITHVFNHFNIKVPRSSVEFTNVGQEVPVSLSKPGDLILFTGTDSTIRVVGHMGIVTQNSDTLKFIHSTSGKQYGVTETPLGDYYKGRFVKVVRIII